MSASGTKQTCHALTECLLPGVKRTLDQPLLTKRPEFVCRYAKDRVTGQKQSPSPSPRTQKLKTPTNRKAHSPSARTHIDIYQGDTDPLTFLLSLNDHGSGAWCWMNYRTI